MANQIDKTPHFKRGCDNCKHYEFTHDPDTGVCNNEGRSKDVPKDLLVNGKFVVAAWWRFHCQEAKANNVQNS